MIDRSKLWTPTGGLYAIAAAIVLLAVATGNSIFSHRYEFAAADPHAGLIWRGDTVSGRAILCAQDFMVEEAKKRGGLLPYESCR